MKNLRLLLLFFLSTIVFNAFAQNDWEVSLRQFPSLPGQVHVWVTKPSTDQPVVCELRFTRPQSRQYLTRRIDLPNEGGGFQVWVPQLPEGKHTWEASCLQAPFYKWEGNIEIKKGDQWQASSLVVSLEKPLFNGNQIPNTQPPLVNKLPVDAKKLHFWVAYKRPAQLPMNARAILYKAQTENGTRTFASEALQASVLSFQNDVAVFEGSFHLDTLPPGTYMVEVLAYQGSRLLGALERSRSFVLPWAGLTPLLERPTDALQRMKHVAPKAWIDQQIAVSSTDGQRKALVDFWESRQPGEGLEAMTNYFFRLQEASQKWGTWEDDRARIYSIYGPPSKISQTSSGDIEWAYARWQLQYTLHQKEEGFYQLVTP